jgi:hypothetical protein
MQPVEILDAPPQEDAARANEAEARRRAAERLCADLDQALAGQGADAAADLLCDRLRREKDYHALFYALLLRARRGLGLNPVPTAPSSEIPPEHHAAYEEAIRQAGREVGGLFLADRNIPQAWSYFRMLGEPGPVRDALDAFELGDADDAQSLVQIAYYEGLHPTKGFGWVLSRFGICSAITTLGGQDLPHPPEVKAHCVRALVRALYSELRGRLAADVAAHEGAPPAEDAAPPETPGVVRALMQGRDWLFGEDCYHIDMSHLSSVVQMSLGLPNGPEIGLARELCAYGARLADRFRQPADPPFEDLYGSHDAYLGTISGEDEAGGLNYFRQQAEQADPETVGTYPAEVYVNLLLKLGHEDEALAAAKRFLRGAFGRRLTCPSVAELCQKAGDYRAFAEVARENSDPVHFLAGLLAGTK